VTDRTLTLHHKKGAGSLTVLLKASERAGRWLVRLELPLAPGQPTDWPGIGDSGTTQRVWVGETEREACDTALNWLRTQYRVSEP
jgi:hypothetical protein